jgi:hypothetical protein
MDRPPRSGFDQMHLAKGPSVGHHDERRIAEGDARECAGHRPRRCLLHLPARLSANSVTRAPVRRWTIAFETQDQWIVMRRSLAPLNANALTGCSNRQRPTSRPDGIS